MRRLVALLALIVGSIVCWEVGSVAVAAQTSVTEELGVTATDPSSAIPITELSVADELSPITGSYGAGIGVSTFAYDAPGVSRVDVGGEAIAESPFSQATAGGGGVASPVAGVEGTSMTPVVSFVTPSGTRRRRGTRLRSWTAW
ncbi:MAG: hypothetical protein WBA45_03165 [Microthrixaceae bacterium]